MRYLASTFGYDCQDPFVQYQVDQLCDDFADFLGTLAGPGLAMTFGKPQEA